MANYEMRALVAGELNDISKSGRDQNLYRMADERARLNGLRSQVEIGPTVLVAHQLVLQTVGEPHPNFEFMQSHRV